MAAGNRKTRRRRRLSLSSSSSSDSDSASDSGTQQPQADLQSAPLPVEEHDSGDSSSSLGLDSSDDSDAEPNAKKPRSDAATATPASAQPFKQQQAKPQNRERSPSPPLFGFPGLSANGKLPPLLHGFVPGDQLQQPLASTSQHTLDRHADEQQQLAAFYLDKVVNHFGKDLDALKQEPGVADRIDLLIKSLGQGANLLSAATADDPNSIWKTAPGHLGDKDILLAAMARPASTSNGHTSLQGNEQVSSDSASGSAESDSDQSMT